MNPNFFIFLSFFIMFLHFFFSFFSCFSHHFSCSFIFSFLFMFFHVLSCPSMFVHVSFIFFHFLSCSFIFCHFLLYSFFLSGAQNLIFFGLNFDTISLDSSYVKNQFLGPSRAAPPPLGPLFLFFLLFCPVFCLFSCFLFFHFSVEKVSSVLFSCISFKYFFARVSIRV